MLIAVVIVNGEKDWMQSENECLSLDDRPEKERELQLERAQ